MGPRSSSKVIHALRLVRGGHGRGGRRDGLAGRAHQEALLALARRGPARLALLGPGQAADLGVALVRAAAAGVAVVMAGVDLVYVGLVVRCRMARTLPAMSLVRPLRPRLPASTVSEQAQ